VFCGGEDFGVVVFGAADVRDVAVDGAGLCASYAGAERATQSSGSISFPHR
jgi:hypothetical protein